MNTLEIRSATPADVTAIAELYEGPSFSDDYFSYVQNCVQDCPSAIVCRAANCVGFAYCREFAPDILELDNIYVTQNYRNRRIGSTLLAHVEKEASNSYGAIILTNSSLYSRKEQKRPATDFYVRHGYNLSFVTAHSNIFTKLLS